MDITDFAKGRSWAIDPRQFDVLARQVAELSVDAAALEAFAAAAKVQRNDYPIYNGVAVIPITGPISKQASFYSYFFDGAALSDLHDVLQEAINDPAVSAICLDIDSPGGTVNGVSDMAAEILAVRSEKPVVAYANGRMASAAYWLGSAADAVIVNKTADVGSIGVLMIHTDYSGYDARVGVKMTYLTAGKYKALGNDAEPLSPEAREVFEKELNYIYGIFIADVSQNRGVSEEQVRADMADGRIFIGAQAVDAGLADEVGTLDDAITLAASLGSERKIQTIRSGGVPPGKEKTTMFGKDKNVAPSKPEELAELYPELCAAIREQGANSVKTEDIVAAERARIMALAIVEFGEAAATTFGQICATGVTAAQYSVIRADKPQKEAPAAPAAPAPTAEDLKRAEMLAAITASGAENPGAGNVVKVDFSKLPLEERCKATWDSDPDLRDEYKMGGIAAFMAFEKNKSNVRLFVKKAE